MEKYGVEQESSSYVNRPKTAETEMTVCKACGGALRPLTETGVIVCVNCGTKPYEV